MATILRVFDTARVAIGDLPDCLDLTQQIIHNGIGVLSGNYPRSGVNADLLSLSAAYLAVVEDGEVQPDWHVLEDDAMSSNGDPNAPIQFAARSVLSMLEWAVVFPQKHTGTTMTVNKLDPTHKFVKATPGAILKTLIDKAKARGALDDLSYNFTATTDSEGNAWGKTYTITYTAGTDYWQVLNGMIEAGWIEAKTTGFTLNVYKAGKLPVDRTDITYRSGKDVHEGTRNRSRRNVRNVMLGVGEGKNMFANKDSSSITTFGRREGNAQDGRMTVDGSLTDLTNKAITESATVKELVSLTVPIGDKNPAGEVTWRPNYHFFAGDYIYWSGKRLDNDDYERLQVKGFTFTWPTATSGGTCTIEFNELKTRWAVSASKRISKVGYGATKPTMPNSGRPVLSSIVKRTGSRVSPATPLAPTPSLNVATLTFDATPSPYHEDGSDADPPSRYEYQWRYAEAGIEWSAARPSDTPTFELSNLEPNRSVAVRVRSIIDGDPPLYSDWLELGATETVPDDTTPPSVPSTPTVTSRLGTITVAWDGMANFSGVMPPDFHLVQVHIGTADNFTPGLSTHRTDITTVGGIAVISDQPYGDAYVRLVAVDTSGNASDPSATVKVTVKALVDTDVIGKVLDGSKFLDQSIGTAALADGSVDASKIGDLATAPTVGGEPLVTVVDATADAQAKADAAEAAAIASAATTAQTKADAAKQAAIDAAAITAQSKADAAKAAAIASAATDATGKSDLARVLAIAAATARTNLVPNGGFRSGPLSQEVRRNRFYNPALLTDTSWWASTMQTSGTITATRETTGGPTIEGSVRNFYRMTVATVSTGALASTGIIFGNPGDDSMTLVPGVENTISVYARSSVTDRTASLVITSHKNDGTNQVIEFSGPGVAIGGGWTRLSGTVTPAAGQVRGYARIYSQGGRLWQVGDTMDATAALCETAPSAFPFFGGSDPTALGLTFSWTGTAGASQSIASGVRTASGWTAGVTNYVNPNTMWLTGANSPGGAKVATLYPGLNGAQTLLAFGYSTSFIPAAPGEFYALRCKVRLVPGAKPSVNPAVFARIGAYDGAGGNIGVSATSATVTVTSAWQEITLPSGTAMPAGTASAAFLLYRSGTWYDDRLELADIIIEKVSATGLDARAFFDGGTTADVGCAVGWVGTANYSASQTWPLLANNSVTAATVAAGAIIAGKLAANSVVADNLSVGSVTASKIVMSDFTNYIVGGSFENDSELTDWTVTGTGMAIDTSRAYAGARSLRIDGSKGPGSEWKFKGIKVTPGTKFLLSFWAYRDAAYNGSVSGAKVRIGDVANAYITALDYAAATIPAGVWTRITGRFDVPAGVTSFTVTTVSDATAGNVWIDSLEMRRMDAAELLVDGSIVATKLATDAVEADKIKAGAIIAGKLAANSVVTANLSAGAVTASKLSVGDTSNMATIDAEPDSATYTRPVVGGVTGVDGKTNWCTRSGGAASQYFMFRKQAGPVPFKVGDRIRLTFEAHVPSGTATFTPYVWVYGGTGGTAAFTLAPVAGSPAATITTAVQTFVLEGNVQSTVTDQTTFLIGLIGADLNTIEPLVRNVRAYRMGAGELIVDGAIKANHVFAEAIGATQLAANSVIAGKIAADAVTAREIQALAVTAAKVAANAITADKLDVGSVTAEKIALGTFGNNLVSDPSFEQTYTIPAHSGAPTNLWRYSTVNGAARVERAARPHSGMSALRIIAGGSGDYLTVTSGAVPVKPGRTYNLSFHAAKELNADTARLYCRLGGGSTPALVEYQGGFAGGGITFGGADPNFAENVAPTWIGNNLFTGDTTVDSNGDGIMDGGFAYTTGTTSGGTRSVSASGQRITATSVSDASRWGVRLGDYPIERNAKHRLSVKYTGYSGTNVRLRVYVDGLDSTLDVPTAASMGTVYPTAAPDGTATVDLSIGDYDTARIYVWFENQTAGTVASNCAVNITSAQLETIDANGLTQPAQEVYDALSGEFTVPAGVNYVGVQFLLYNVTAAQSLFVDDVSIIEKGVGGSELTAAGLRLFGVEGTEVAAFVSNRANYFSVTKSGRTLASVSDDGGGSFQTLSVAGRDNGYGVYDSGFSIYGTEFMEWLNTMPRGCVARANRDTNSSSTTGTEIPILELQYTEESGRLYEINWAAPIYQSGATVTPSTIFRLRRTIDGTTPGITSSELRGIRIIWKNTSSTTMWTFGNKLSGFNSGGSRDVRLLLTMVAEASSGTQYVSATAAAPAEFWVKDIGPWVEDTGIDRVAASPPATKKTYTTTWTSTNACCYMGNGSKDSSQGSGDMKQGYSSYDGDSKSLWTFPSMTSTLSGATISKIRVYLYANHWYYNSGGTARIKVHGYSSIPGSSPSMTTAVDSSSWPKPGGRWVTLPSSLHAGFISGAYKGIGVGPAGSSSLTYYGKFNKSGAKIEITYVK